jgi:NADPH:quinone reductase-like Zn-dependent oxidoreductase
VTTSRDELIASILSGSAQYVAGYISEQRDGVAAKLVLAANKIADLVEDSRGDGQHTAALDRSRRLGRLAAIFAIMSVGFSLLALVLALRQGGP